MLTVIIVGKWSRFKGENDDCTLSPEEHVLKIGVRKSARCKQNRQILLKSEYSISSAIIYQNNIVSN